MTFYLVENRFHKYALYNNIILENAKIRLELYPNKIKIFYNVIRYGSRIVEINYNGMNI